MLSGSNGNREICIKTFNFTFDKTRFNNNENQNNTYLHDLAISASNSLTNVISELSQDDDYFNYLSFIISDVGYNTENKPFYIFNSNNNFDNLKSMLEKSKFRGFVLYDFNSKKEKRFRRKTANGNFQNNNDENESPELKCGFMDKIFLSGLCCLNRKFLNEIEPESILKQKLNFNIKHEFSHNLNASSKNSNKFNLQTSPLIKEIQNAENGEIGNLIEILLTVKIFFS